MRIREIRKSRSLTAKTLKEFMGVAPVQIYRWGSGSRSLNANFLQKLAKALDCNVAETLRNPDEPTSPLPKQSLEEETDTPLASFTYTVRNNLPVNGTPLVEVDGVEAFKFTGDIVDYNMRPRVLGKAETVLRSTLEPASMSLH